jgi:hypothetical protein
MYRKRLAVIVGALVAVAAAIAGALVWTLPASAAHSIKASTTDPVFWLCHNNKNGANTGTHRYDGTGSYPGCGSGYTIWYWSAAGAAGAQGPAGPAGNVFVADAQPADDSGSVTLAHIGGPIQTNVTPLTKGITLQPGTYQIDAGAVFTRRTNPAPAAAPNTYAEIVVWLDNNSDGQLDWKQGETASTQQTPAIPKPVDADSIEASASTTVIVHVTETTTLYLGGMAYNDDASSWGTPTDSNPAGEFSAVPNLSVLSVVSS